ncbi:hypothetical protein ACB098_03G182400 [Castanea mollissima]
MQLSPSPDAATHPPRLSSRRRSPVTAKQHGPTALDPTSSTFFVIDPKTLTPQKPTVEKVRPYPRKWENHTMSRIKEVTLVSSPIIPNCEIQHKAPAIVFSAGGLTGNIFHDFNDGFIPLFITANSIFPDQDVEILRTFTKYPIINLDNDTIPYCFPSANVGIISHDLVTIDPKLIPNSKTLTQIQNQNHHFKFNHSKSRPILVLISHNGGVGRVLLNQNKVKFEAEKIGFNVIIFEPTPMTPMHKACELIHSGHAMIGIHGAALTHTIFLRPGSVFMQVVPLGTEWVAEVCYARLARSVGSEYMEYRIEAEESSLLEKYSKDDLVTRDPVAFRGTDWSLMNIYLKEQNVTLDLVRFREYLKEMYKKAKKFMNKEG